MLLTKKTEYAVRCMVYMALQKDKIVNNKEIASAMNIPEYFLSKVLHSLIQKGIVISSRGKNGGYTLANTPDEISLLEIIEAIQGPLKFFECFLHEKNCESKRECTINRIWTRINTSLEQELEGVKIAEFLSVAENLGKDQNIPKNCFGLPGCYCCQTMS